MKNTIPEKMVFFLLFKIIQLCIKKHYFSYIII